MRPDHSYSSPTLWKLAGLPHIVVMDSGSAECAADCEVCDCVSLVQPGAGMFVSLPQLESHERRLKAELNAGALPSEAAARIGQQAIGFRRSPR